MFLPAFPTFKCDNMICGGDFNFVFNLDLDKEGGARRTNFNARKDCFTLMEKYDLIDIWRDRNPFTWHSNISEIHCRLDSFIVSRHLSFKVKDAFFQPTFHTDHCMVVL
ncbi:hypothetical protein HOLleu_06188 [Holothuria leucospilota]|uniref:Endonuclease/exonuclease/phosphatase domain-containing protein n=1 Tax=Holothuria leucospilota TaxID=206669 RepID=A0A9Q1HIR3_HOLLE|nr:hypothetical protein HOLleu_06188 [Holothuria leucospilota]